LPFVLTALLVAVGVAAFVGLRGTVRDLERSRDRFEQETRFADYVVTGGDTQQFARAAGAVRGVEAVNTRSTTTLSVWTKGGRTKVQGTIIGVPPDGPVIDDVVITDGRAFPRATPSSVAVVEHHTADDLGIHPGDTLQALGIGSVEELRVAGVGLSPEYLMPAQDQQQLVSAPGSFAVLYVPASVATALGGAAAIPQVLVRYEAGADAAALDRELSRLAARSGAALAEPRSAQPSSAVLDEEQAGFREAGLVLGGLVLLLATAVGALGASLVEDRRVRYRRLAVSYVAGTVAGVVVGLVVARFVGAWLADSLDLPDHEADANVVVALAAAALAAVSAALVVAFSAVVRSRGDRTSRVGPAIVTGIAAAIGVAAVVAPAGVVDSAEATLDAAATLERVDAQVAFATPVTSAEIAALRGIDGVAAAEPVPSAKIVVRHGGRRYATEMQAFAPRTTMQRFESPDGARLALPARGVLVPESLGRVLHARPGDEVEVTIPGAGIAPFRVPIGAFTSDTLGNLVFLRTSVLRDALGADANAFAGGLFDTASIRFRSDADPLQIARDVQALSSVVVYVPVRADLNSVADARPIFATVVDAFLAIGALIALLGVSSALVVHRHATGQRSQGGFALEALVAVIVGVIVGAAVGTIGARRLVDRLDSDLIHLVRTVDASTYLFAALVVVGVSAIVVGVGALAGRPGAHVREPAATSETGLGSAAS
jgi:putative ABC transport system permease protein